MIPEFVKSWNMLEFVMAHKAAHYVGRVFKSEMNTEVFVEEDAYKLLNYNS